jgi:hypothetical protein
MYGIVRNTYNVLVGKPEGMKPLGRHESGKIILEWILAK